MLGLKPVKLMPARERVASALRKAIISRQIKEGETLALEATAQELGVSITPVREAFQILARDGLLELKQNKGATVLGVTEKTLRDHREEDESADGIRELPDLKITLLKSGPLGGDQQLGSLIADGKINALIFFWDPMSAQPHDVDVKALLRLATLYNVPTAINRSSADFLISSPLFEDEEYEPVVKDYKAYVERVLK